MAASGQIVGTGRSSHVPPPLVIAALIALAGLAGVLGPAWGYGLFTVATLLLIAGAILAAILVLSARFDTDALRRATGAAFWLGAWTYVLAVAALAGYFAREALDGRMPWKWIVFGPAALAAIAVLDWGLYRVIYKRNEATLARYGDVIDRNRVDRPALRRTFLDEVVLHRTLLSVSRFRWVRHQLILWGFALMFAFELGAVFLREVQPALGLGDVWHAKGHPVRLVWDAAFDITGLMILVGCVLALVYRLRVNGTPEQKFTDTPTVVFLLAVVVSGFIVEGLRIAGAPPSPHHAASPVGVVFAGLLSPFAPVSKGTSDVLWVIHALLSCAFIAYVPLKRLIHSCATPIGRLMNSQKAMLAAKKERSLRGLLERRPPG
jgi:nitrate reductase gamma subunit